jgi:diacylglycerol kinase (ATP)
MLGSRSHLDAGTHVDQPGVTVHHAARVELSAPDLVTYADGEPVAPLPAVAECVPGALRIVGTGR